MATQTVELRAATGLTLTAKLFSAGSDTQVDSQSATEAVNRLGTYSVAYTDVAAGTYRLIAFSGSTPVAAWWVDLTLTTATFQAYDMPPAIVQEVASINTSTAETIADAVWDEDYASHTTAGTFGKLLDILRKSNLTVDGAIVDVSPSTTAFNTDLTAPTSTYQHRLLLFTSGALEGMSRPIDGYNQTNGAITMQEAFSLTPSNGDEFIILTDHIHPISDIQAGLATQASVDVIDGIVDDILVDTGTTIPATITLLINQAPMEAF